MINQQNKQLTSIAQKTLFENKTSSSSTKNNLVKKNSDAHTHINPIVTPEKQNNLKIEFNNKKKVINAG